MSHGGNNRYQTHWNGNRNQYNNPFPISSSSQSWNGNPNRMMNNNNNYNYNYNNNNNMRHNQFGQNINYCNNWNNNQNNWNLQNSYQNNAAYNMNNNNNPMLDLKNFSQNMNKNDPNQIIQLQNMISAMNDKYIQSHASSQYYTSTTPNQMSVPPEIMSIRANLDGSSPKAKEKRRRRKGTKHQKDADIINKMLCDRATKDGILVYIQEEDQECPGYPDDCKKWHNDWGKHLWCFECKQGVTAPSYGGIKHHLQKRRHLDYYTDIKYVLSVSYCHMSLHFNKINFTQQGYSTTTC